jgi:hypothetical protein
MKAGKHNRIIVGTASDKGKQNGGYGYSLPMMDLNALSCKGNL